MRLLTSCALLLMAACTGNQTTTATHEHSATAAPAATSSAAASPAAATMATMTNQKFATAVGTGSGYLSLPKSRTAKHPAIIVIHEWWGLDEWIRQNTDRFAAAGYVALAPDLYHGRATSDPSEAHELMRGVPEDRALADLQGAFTYLASRPDVDVQHIGVIGWCMGGGYALQLAVNQPKLAAVVVNYGHLVSDPKNVASISAPLLGNFGATDRGIPAADVEAFDKALRAAGKSSDIKIYPGVGHAFMNPHNTTGYSAEAATDAWKRIDEFLASKLRGSVQ